MWSWLSGLELLKPCGVGARDEMGKADLGRGLYQSLVAEYGCEEGCVITAALVVPDGLEQC